MSRSPTLDAALRESPQAFIETMAPIIHSLGESLAALEEALTEFAERQEQGGKLLRLVPRGGSDAG